MRIVRIVLVVIGVILVVAGAIWRPVVVPQFTTLPNSFSQTVQLSGTYTGYVNQATGAPLATPQRVPLTLTESVKSVPGESTSSVLVISETSASSMGPVTSTTVAQYALNRSTDKNVSSPHAYDLSPSIVVDRSGAYTLLIPEGASTAQSYPVYVDEAGRTVPETSEHTTPTVDGLATQGWQENLASAPVTPAIATATKLPPSMPFATFAAEAKAEGLDLTAAFAGLMPILTPAQRASLASVTTEPIPLEYLYSQQLKQDVVPATGTSVDVVSLTNSLSVEPNLSKLAAALTPILEAHAANPVAARLIASASKLSSVKPTPMYSISASQTPASVATLVSSAKHDVTVLSLLKVWVPVVLIVVGLILIAVGLLVGRRRKAARAAAGENTAGETVTEESTIEDGA